MAAHNVVAAASSTILRISSLLFFRYFPAVFPYIIFASFAAYVPSFLSTFYANPTLEVLEDTRTTTIKETTAEPSRYDQAGPNAEPRVVAQELSVREDIVVAEKETSPLSVLLWGVPSIRQMRYSALTFVFNAVLVLMAVDFLFRARFFYPTDDLSFVRLGYVSHSEAKFLIREPDQAQMPVTLELHIKDPRPPFDNPKWHTAGAVRWTTNETDFTAALSVSLIHQDQRVYEWRTSNNHSGEFLAAPAPGKMPEYNDGKYTFLSTSCILPRFPYNPMDHALAIPGLRSLAEKLPELGAQFMLFLGDFIYIDVPNRFGKSVDEYRMQYRQVYASPDWNGVAQNLSWIHVLDDHEIANDWSSGTAGMYQAALEPWNIYQANLNPPKAMVAGSSRHRRTDATWFEFIQGPASFFMMDTRSYRSSNDMPFHDTNKTMLGADQLEDLLAWLAKPEPRGVKWKFVASSVPFTKNWPVNLADTWGGFKDERSKVLEAMWDAGARGTSVVILSGDRHEFAATKFPPPPDSRWPESAAAFEFSTSPLNQFASPFDTYKQTDDEDVMIKYIPSGTSKFGSFTMEDVDGESKLLYQLFIDGKVRWTKELTSPTSTGQGSNPFSSLWSRINRA